MTEAVTLMSPIASTLVVVLFASFNPTQKSLVSTKVHIMHKCDVQPLSRHHFFRPIIIYQQCHFGRLVWFLVSIGFPGEVVRSLVSKFPAIISPCTRMCWWWCSFISVIGFSFRSIIGCWAWCFASKAPDLLSDDFCFLALLSSIICSVSASGKSSRDSIAQRKVSKLLGRLYNIIIASISPLISTFINCSLSMVSRRSFKWSLTSHLQASCAA